MFIILHMYCCIPILCITHNMNVLTFLIKYDIILTQIHTLTKHKLNFLTTKQLLSKHRLYCNRISKIALIKKIIKYKK